MKKNDKGQEYIDAFPKLKKWINECSCCHRKGYKPDMPEKITVVEGSTEVWHIKKYFKPLNINQNGLCDVCANIVAD